MTKRIALSLLLTLVAAGLYAQGLPIKNGSSSQLAKIDANGGLRVVGGPSLRCTYNANVSGQACTAATILSLEAPAASDLRVRRICVNTTEATAGTGVTITVARRTTASSGGTALTAEGTGTTNVSKYDSTSAGGTCGNFSGVGRLGGTPGTGGAVLDQWAFVTGEIGTGTETVPSLPSCMTYGTDGTQMPTVAAGTANGLSVNISSAGAGALAFCSISVDFVAESTTP